ncbi:sensor histidine kinase [Paenibacillus rhizoplanae]
MLITATYDMARRLNSLIMYKYQMELKQKESQLQLLYQQINPHLLYNTLESIYWKKLARRQRGIGGNDQGIIQADEDQLKPGPGADHARRRA